MLPVCLSVAGESTNLLGRIIKSRKSCRELWFLGEERYELVG